jgi:NhaP-type Na+/H+ or K+/H+ antiporter
MKPDFLFVGVGSVVLGLAVVLALTAFRRDQRFRWRAALLWAILGAGFLVQGFAPHLKIKDDMFVLPASLMTEAKSIDPKAIVTRERRMQLLSGILTVGATVGLAFHYRRFFGRWFSPADKDSLQSETPAS